MIFQPFSTVFQSYQVDERKINKCCVHCFYLYMAGKNSASVIAGQCLTFLYSELPKLFGVMAILSAEGVNHRPTRLFT